LSAATERRFSAGRREKVRRPTAQGLNLKERGRNYTKPLRVPKEKRRYISSVLRGKKKIAEITKKKGR